MSATTTSTPMSEVLQLQRSAFHRDGPPSAAMRRDRIDRLANAVISHTDELVEAISTDFGHRAEVTTLVTDLSMFAVEAEHARARVSSWMKPRKPWGTLGSLGAKAVGIDAAIHPVPLGVVGIMGIWNFPLNLTAIPALSALAAGNRVMIKMPEQLPLTSEVFANAVHDVFDVEEVAVLTGGVEVSKAFAALKLDHLFFTGSARTGSAVMAAAAKNLTPVTLELGGKNPVVVSPKAKDSRALVKKAAQRVAQARIVNSGQVCISPDVVYVPEKVAKPFVQEIFSTWGEIMPQMFAEDDVTTLVDDSSYERVVSLLDDAAAKGAQVLSSVRSDEHGVQALQEARIMPPTVVLGVTDEMRISREEIFGPVIAVHSYTGLDEVLDLLATRSAPLVSTWYGPDDGDYRSFVARTRSGGVARNDWALSQALPGLPFGGVGGSGMGRYHGKFGFETFSHLRTVAGSDLPLSFASLANPSDERITNFVKSLLSQYHKVLARRRR